MYLSELAQTDHVVALSAVLLEGDWEIVRLKGVCEATKQSRNDKGGWSHRVRVDARGV
jgi:hypothetical protein